MSAPLPRWKVRVASVGDALTGLFVLMALWTHLFGGFRIGSGLFVISTRSVEPLLIQAALVCLLRHVLVREASLRSRLARWIGAAPSALVDVPRREWWMALASYTAAVVVFLWPQVTLPGGVPDHGDPLFSMWTIAHIADRLLQSPATWLDGRIFHPEVDTFLWSDITLIPGLLAAPFIWAGVPVAAAYTSLFLLGAVLGGVTMYGLARATTGLVVPAWVAGAIFAFFPYRFAQYSHLQMQGIFFMPLAVWLLLRTLERPTVRHACGLGLVVALQTLWSTYCGAYLVVGLAAVTLGWWISGRPIGRSHLRAGLAAAALAAVCIAPYVTAYYRVRDVVGERPRSEVMHYEAEWSDYFNPNGHSAWYGEWAPMHSKSEERHLFPGAGTLALSAAGLLAGPSTVTVMAATGLMAAIDGSFGLSGLTYTVFYDYIPMLKTFRVPARFGLVAGVFLAWGAGLGAARLWRWSDGRPRARAGVLLFCAAVVLEIKPGVHLIPTPLTMPAIYEALPDDRQVVLLELPIPGQGAEAFWVDPSYLYAATFHGHTLINGYSGYYPDWYGRLTWASSALPSDDAWAAIQSYGAEYLVVHEEHYGPDRYREVTADLARRADVTLEAVTHDARGERRLYRVWPPAASGPAPAPPPPPSPGAR